MSTKTFNMILAIFALNDVNSAADTCKAILINKVGLDKLNSGLLGVAFTANEVVLTGAVGDVLDAAAALNATGILDSPIARNRKARAAAAVKAS